MRIVFSLFLFAHAIAHVPGFLVEWHLIESKRDLPYRRTVLNGRVNVGTMGARVMGMLWLVAGLGVALAAVSFYRNTAAAWGIGWAAVGFSSIMTILGWPDSKTGAALNTIALAFLAWVTLLHS